VANGTSASQDQDAELGYAVTDHAAQSRTVTAGLAVITGTEDRQHAYVALSRGTDVNLAYVFTAPPKRADPAPDPHPAPELARYDRRVTAPGTQPAPAAMPGEALAVLAGVLNRDGQQHSATQTHNQAVSGGWPGRPRPCRTRNMLVTLYLWMT
jgi:hypothetical protein